MAMAYGTEHHDVHLLPRRLQLHLIMTFMEVVQFGKCN